MKLTSIHEAGQHVPGPKNSRNLLTDYDDTLLAMAEVEGLDNFGRYNDRSASSWLALQEQNNQYTASGILRQLHQLPPLEDDDDDYRGRMPIATIYGSGGYNRWPVCRDGMVVFSGGPCHRQPFDRQGQTARV